MLIIGCGNRERADDGAGLQVAEQLCRRGFQAVCHTGDSLSLIDLWSNAEDVILVDAVVTGNAPPGTVWNWNADRPLSALRPSASSHGFGVAEAIELAHKLGRLPPGLCIYGIEATNFAIGEEMSLAVEDTVQQLVQQLAAEATQSARMDARTFGGAKS